MMAGIFYPEDGAALERAVRDLLDAVPQAPESGIGMRQAPTAIVSPHGAFTHSGAVQALAWNAARADGVSRIVVIGPRHAADRTALVLPESELFETPLGDIEVDRASVESIADSCSDFQIYDIPHLGEHSIELQLPFMRLLFPGARLVPVLMGHPSPASLRAVARALDAAFAGSAGSTLFVISSNMCMDAEPAMARAKTEAFLSSIRTAEPDGERALQRTCLARDAPCGAAGIAALAATSMFEGLRAEVLGMADSDAAREQREEPVVSYAALRLVRFRQDAAP